ncbi:MAG: RecQ family ATP-dependent DNA helicase [Lentisphaerales bacterium]|nr:RecQ family ATP-dependent DNA helicase [Lentisphaerales bacterium]
MQQDIDTTLKSKFGFDSFRTGQREVISQLIYGNSSLAVFPTGSGKSLCYQLTALHLDALTLVISPLIALMKDQVDFLTEKGIPAAKMDSSLSLTETHQVWDDIRQNKLKLLYIAPERLANEKFLQKLQTCRISMMVIDEAHCLSEWGHNFRPDYLKLTHYRKFLKIDKVLALTATATPKVAEDICNAFEIIPEAYINTGYYRPNLFLKMTRCNPQDKLTLLTKRLADSPAGPTIVYVTLQKEAETTAEFLCEQGYHAIAYHAGLKPELRTEIQELFMRDQIPIVVATIAFGMGIDKADIRYVYHLNLPKSMENYAQEIGRAGRDGLNSSCETFASHQDAIVQANFTYGDTPTQESILPFIEHIFSHEKDFHLSTYQASGTYDIRPLVINTLLCYLELQGSIQSTGHFYNTFKFQPLISSKDILAKFDPQRAAFLKGIFQKAKKGRIWFTLDIMELCESTGADIKRITQALNYLDNEGMLKTQVAEARATFRILQPVNDLQSLSLELSQKFKNSEDQQIQRLQNLITMTGQSTCIVNSLLSYFGEKRQSPCGHCDRCTDSIDNLETNPGPYQLKPQDQQLIAAAKSLENNALQSPRNLAKFLCGISSPSMSRSRPALSKHELFGSLSHIPFQLILES